MVRQSEIEIIVSKCIEATILAIHFQEGDENFLTSLSDELHNTVRNELTKAGVPVQRKRLAVVTSPSAGHLNTIRDYLPSNYTAHESNGTIHGNVILIEGYDRAGWTLEDYVIPRLASGLICAKEVKS